MSSTENSEWVRAAATEIYEKFIEWKAFDPAKDDRIAAIIAEHAEGHAQAPSCTVCGAGMILKCPSCGSTPEPTDAPQAAPAQPQITALIEAAKKIKHWHDWGKDNEGMVVSSESVFELWKARDALTAILPAPPSAGTEQERLLTLTEKQPDATREFLRAAMMKHFSDKLSMDEIGNLIYDVYPAEPRPRE